jgi:HK97 family phage major capsid protein
MATTAKDNLRDQLKRIRSGIEEKRTERAEKVKVRDEAKEKFAGSDVPIDQLTETDDFKAAEQAVKEVGELDDAINQLKAAETGVLEMLGESAPDPEGPNGNGPSGEGVTGRGWDVQGLVEGAEYQRLKEAGAFSSAKSHLGSILLGKLADREHAARLLGADPLEVGSDEKTGAIPADRRGIIPPNLKKLSLLDLIPTGVTDSNQVEYVQVLAIPNTAREIAEGDEKPEETLVTKDADAPVRTIAGFIKVRKQALADVAGLRTLIGTLLPYDVRRRIESQMLIGDGSGQNLTGILETDGIGAPSFQAGDNTADAILRAITVIILSDADPNFVTLHPITWQELLTMRTETGGAHTGMYLYGAPAEPAPPTIWGLNITVNRAVPSDQPLVGDAMAASLLVREGVNVLVSDSADDDFTHNRVTILAEARVAFPVWKPTSFAVAALS